MKSTDRRLSQDEWVAAVRTFAGGFIAYDPCTEPDNPTGAIAFCTEPLNGLDTDWRKVALAASARFPVEIEPIYPTTIHNPPWSERLIWDYAAAAFGRDGHSVISFSAVDFARPWWRTLCRTARLRCELSARPRCVDPQTGKRMDVGRSGAAWLIADKGMERRFADAFERLGAIVEPGSPDWDPLARVSVQVPEEVQRAAE